MYSTRTTPLHAMIRVHGSVIVIDSGFLHDNCHLVWIYGAAAEELSCFNPLFLAVTGEKQPFPAVEHVQHTSHGIRRRSSNSGLRVIHRQWGLAQIRTL